MRDPDATALHYYRAGLGRLRDTAVAHALGVSATAVGAVRRSEGIPSAAEHSSHHLCDYEVSTPVMDRRNGVLHRNQQLVAILRMLALMRFGRFRAADLAAALGQTKRTIYRALNACEAAGVRLERTSEPAGIGGQVAYYHVTAEALRAAGLYG